MPQLPSQPLSALAQASAPGLDASGQMTDAMLTDVRRVEQLVRLDVSGSKAVTDEGVEGLAGFHNWPVLKTWQGGQETMALLSCSAGPNYLNLRGPFADRGLERLQGLDGSSR